MRTFNKIFGTGLPCTGTAQLASGLRAVGIQTVHWPPNMLDICQAQAAVDITVACRFEELDQVFSGSLFIHTERSEPEWLDAIANRYRSLGPELQFSEGDRLFALEADIRVFGRVRPQARDFKAAYARHNAAVRHYFRGRPDRLVKLDLEQANWRDTLYQFLQIQNPEAALALSGALSGRGLLPAATDSTGLR